MHQRAVRQKLMLLVDDGGHRLLTGARCGFDDEDQIRGAVRDSRGRSEIGRDQPVAPLLPAQPRLVERVGRERRYAVVRQRLDRRPGPVRPA